MVKLSAPRLLLIASCLSLFALVSLDWSRSRGHAAEGGDGYGSFTGQIVFDGDVPERKVLVAKGSTEVKDPAICAASDVLSDALIVDPQSKGIANVFVYLQKAPQVHPKLKESAVKEVVFDQKGCRFVPHVLLLRTDQTVVVKSDDGCAHNTHTNPFRGQGVNFLLPPNSRDGTKISSLVAERLPFPVTCDIHSWMKAHWLILDHPYAAVTDEKGKFTIADLPAGEYEFIVWQELSGYIEKKLKVKVTGGKVTDVGVVKAPADKFK